MPRFEPHPQRRPALVAGASSGIGAATAIKLAQLGHPVALGARRRDKCAELVEQLRADGHDAVALDLDVTSDESVAAFVAAAEAAHGPTEIMVNAAGDIDPGELHTLAPGAFAAQVDVHLVGAHRMAAAVLPGMTSRRRGDAVFIGSDVALVPRPHLGAYGAAKAGVIAMVETMRMELEGTGVRASVVHPGPTQTAMGSTWSAEATGPLLEAWMAWGFARHPFFLRAAHLADAVATVVGQERGAHIVSIEVEPEAPLKEPAEDSVEQSREAAVAAEVS
ncbi:SDR family oxidoreductase [Rhodococcus sp. HNM0569]|uniref:SDR family oxidoreductase n=1 Tax=Rhodococcus sp. HNM0569 TaxID=2716340 RepID=UPI00146D8125|nr:SDR family oxidoreductase [Rhodococcus sp. HNM0569]NLU83313.1 SDR family oxidoreductase [Rhodococcus sp. HNM0569]